MPFIVMSMLFTYDCKPRSSYFDESFVESPTRTSFADDSLLAYCIRVVFFHLNK